MAGRLSGGVSRIIGIMWPHLMTTLDPLFKDVAEDIEVGVGGEEDEDDDTELSGDSIVSS